MKSRKEITDTRVVERSNSTVIKLLNSPFRVPLYPTSKGNLSPCISRRHWRPRCHRYRCLPCGYPPAVRHLPVAGSRHHTVLVHFDPSGPEYPGLPAWLCRSRAGSPAGSSVVAWQPVGRALTERFLVRSVCLRNHRSTQDPVPIPNGP